MLQIHDQILFDAPQDALTDVAPIIIHEMEDFDFMIPPIVDVKVGLRWSDLTDYTVPAKAAA
jgi:DNA polymerase I-like protein with 3'-5' exonuclease and polymerase domains